MNAFLISLSLFFQVHAPIAYKDSFSFNKKPIKTYFFKQSLSLRNATLKTRYAFTKRINSIRQLGSEWELTFEDNFDSLDTKKWRLGQPWGEFHPDNPHQYYAKDLITTDSGFLHLYGAYHPKQFASGDSTINIPLGVGLINSDISFKQKYGYFEIRSKNPQGAATWPAFWLTGATRWPPEIDIFEMYGRKNGRYVHNQIATIHYGKTNTRSRGWMSKKINLPNNTDTLFHTYACEWSPYFIKFYTDGKPTAFIRVNKTLRQWMDEEMVVIINNSFDEKYLKYFPDITKVKNDFVVDWVRVWRRKPIVN